MNYLGIDIGSTAAKTVLLSQDGDVLYMDASATGWSAANKAEEIRETLAAKGYNLANAKTVATGYGRGCVDYADKSITEITCHAKGAAHIFGSNDATVIDIGGQDMKIITLKNGKVLDFLMNDKCSAGTGQFLTIMADTLHLTMEQLCELAREGKDVQISSMCTVFAQSEVIGLIGNNTPKENIAHAVIDSMVLKVKSLASKVSGDSELIYLTGGLCELDYILEQLSAKIGKKVYSSPQARFAGAIGAALAAKEL